MAYLKCRAQTVFILKTHHVGLLNVGILNISKPIIHFGSFSLIVKIRITTFYELESTFLNLGTVLTVILRFELSTTSHSLHQHMEHFMLGSTVVFPVTKLHNNQF